MRVQSRGSQHGDQQKRRGEEEMQRFHLLAGRQTVLDASASPEAARLRCLPGAQPRVTREKPKDQVPKHSHKAQVRVRIKMLKFARAVRVHPASRMALGRAQLQRGQRPLIVFPCCERVLPWPPGTPVCIFQDPEDGTWPDDMRPPIQARSGVPRQSLSQQFMCRLPRPRQRTAATRCGGTPRLAATWRRLSCVRR